MCMGAPSMPSIPPTPPPPAPPPPAPAPVEPAAPAPPPTNAVANEAVKLKGRKSKRAQIQQSSQGAAALRIPLNTGVGVPGSAGAAAKKAGGALNIPN